MRIYVYGAGGQGKVVAEIVLAARLGDLAGFVDDDPKLAGSRVLSSTVTGNGDWLERQKAREDLAVVPAVGNNETRRRIQKRLEVAGVNVIAAIHPSAVVSPSARIARGTVVMAQVVINAEARIDEGAIINTGSIIEHDVVVGAFAHVSPRAVLGGAASLGELSHLAIGATVLPGVRVGRKSIVGAGAVVVRDLPDGVVAFGVPARPKRAIE